jgi:PAS domain-containing protein
MSATVAELTFAIGEVAAMLGISPHTIRAWERRHLVVRPMRTSAGQRRYSSDDVELLRQIKHERHVHGLSMRVATLTAHGLVVPDTEEPGPASPPTPAVDAGSDPLRMVADLVPEVVVVVDTQGRVAHANTAFARFCELTLGQLRGVPLADFVDPFDRAKAVQAYQEPLRRRRDWELNLHTPRRRAFFSFDCWPIASAEGPMLVLVGHDLTVEPLPAEAIEAVSPVPAGPEGGAAERLGALLDGAADPVRTLGLAREWLDATPLGVVLTGAAADLPVVFANRAFRAWLPPECEPEGRSWHALRPDAQGEAGRLVAAAAEAIRSGRSRSVRGRRHSRGAPVWDVEVAPVAQAGGSVTQLVLVAADVTAETVAASRLEALVACGPSMRRAADPGQLRRSAARHARDLLPNAGSLLATVADGDLRVVAASGVWSRSDRGADHDLRLALVQDAVRTCASIEVERAGAGEEVETLRVVPLPARGRALGALAFSRLGRSCFPADDRQLIDEFADRVGTALGNVV